MPVSAAVVNRRGRRSPTMARPSHIFNKGLNFRMTEDNVHFSEVTARSSGGATRVSPARFPSSRRARHSGGMVTGMPESSDAAELLRGSDLAALDARLESTDQLLETRFPGDDGRRQPVHTVYVPADRYHPDLPAQWGAAAAACVEARRDRGGLAAPPGWIDGSPPRSPLASCAKLAAEPIEDLRLDFEDGYGPRPDDEEDARRRGDGEPLADAAPPGPRRRCRPAVQVLRGADPPPRATHPRPVPRHPARRPAACPTGWSSRCPRSARSSQVAGHGRRSAGGSRRRRTPRRSLRFEIQVETPQLIIGADGTRPVAAADPRRWRAGHRPALRHLRLQRLAAASPRPTRPCDHPAADFAKQVDAGGRRRHRGAPVRRLHQRAAGRRPAQVHAAWRLHAGLVRRALERGFYQGWDLHPAPAADPLRRDLRVLPTRAAAGVVAPRQLRLARRLADPRRARYRAGPRSIPPARPVVWRGGGPSWSRAAA